VKEASPAATVAESAEMELSPVVEVPVLQEMEYKRRKTTAEVIIVLFFMN